MELIKHSHKGNLLYNEKTGFYEVWNDGRRLYEILTTDEERAVEEFTRFAGKTWEPNGEQGSK